MLFPSASAVVVAQEKMDQDLGMQRQLQQLQDCWIQQDIFHNCSDGSVSQIEHPVSYLHSGRGDADSFVCAWLGRESVQPAPVVRSFMSQSRYQAKAPRACWRLARRCSATT